MPRVGRRIRPVPTYRAAANAFHFVVLAAPQHNPDDPRQLAGHRATTAAFLCTGARRLRNQAPNSARALGKAIFREIYARRDTKASSRRSRAACCCASMAITSGSPVSFTMKLADSQLLHSAVVMAEGLPGSVGLRTCVRSPWTALKRRSQLQSATMRKLVCI
jgi:hypothetical protein